MLVSGCERGVWNYGEKDWGRVSAWRGVGAGCERLDFRIYLGVSSLHLGFSCRGFLCTTVFSRWLAFFPLLFFVLLYLALSFLVPSAPSFFGTFFQAFSLRWSSLAFDYPFVLRTGETSDLEGSLLLQC